MLCPKGGADKPSLAHNAVSGDRLIGPQVCSRGGLPGIDSQYL
jgi:hypothetical protein